MQTNGSRYGDSFRLTLLTNNPRLAAEADQAGIDRIGIDFERVGKQARQAGMDTLQSQHELDDLSRIGPAVRHATLFARLNPIHPQTEYEVETALELGARVLMLPNFRTAEEVAIFARAIHGRALVQILVETAPAATRIRQILAVRGIDEVMVGLNDLHLQLGVSNHFELFTTPLLEMLAAEVRRAGLPFGAGAVARRNDPSLPIPADLVYAQYPRLGATGAWIARSFGGESFQNGQMKDEIRCLRTRLSEWADCPPEALDRARDELAAYAAKWVKRSGHTA